MAVSFEALSANDGLLETVIDPLVEFKSSLTTGWARSGDMLLLDGDSSSFFSFPKVVRILVRGLCGTHTFSYGLLLLDASIAGDDGSNVKMPLNSSSDEFKLRTMLGDCKRRSRGREPFVLILSIEKMKY